MLSTMTSSLKSLARTLVVVLLSATCLFDGGAWALPSGAPSMACSSMTPYHFGFRAQPVEQSPFVIRQSRLRYRFHNETVKVVLAVKNGSGNDHGAFRGFLVQAIDPMSNKSVGQFREQTDAGLLRRCHAATHTNAGNKARVVLHWIPDDTEPVSETRMVVFEGTFVENFKTFFVRVPSTYRGQPARRVAEKLHEHTADNKADRPTGDVNTSPAGHDKLAHLTDAGDKVPQHGNATSPDDGVSQGTHANAHSEAQKSGGQRGASTVDKPDVEHSTQTPEKVETHLPHQPQHAKQPKQSTFWF